MRIRERFIDDLARGPSPSRPSSRRRASFGAWDVDAVVEFAVVMRWIRSDWGIRSPVTVCRVAPVTTAADGIGDLEAFETEREAHELGYRWCECFTVDSLDGERAAGSRSRPTVMSTRTGSDDRASRAARCRPGIGTTEPTNAGLSCSRGDRI
jgi:hypothetical protein